MDENAMNHSLLSWASEDHRTPAKRQKLETSYFSSLNNSSECLLGAGGNCRSLKTELVTIRARLSQSEITSVCLNNVRKEIDEIHEREKIVLQMQVKSDSEVIEQLRGDLGAAKMSAREAREAQVATESEKSKLKIRMEEKVSEMQIEVNRLKEMIPSNCEDSSATPKSREDDPEGLKTKLEAAGTKIIELEKENLISQKNLEEAKMIIQKFNSEKSRAEDLEQQLEYLKNVISTLSEAVKQKDLLRKQISRMQDNSKYKETLKHQVVKILHDKFEGSASNQFSAASKDRISRHQQTDPIWMDEGGLRSRVDDLEKKLEELERKTEEALKIGGIF